MTISYYIQKEYIEKLLKQYGEKRFLDSILYELYEKKILNNALKYENFKLDKINTDKDYYYFLDFDIKTIKKYSEKYKTKIKKDITMALNSIFTLFNDIEILKENNCYNNSFFEEEVKRITEKHKGDFYFYDELIYPRDRAIIIHYIADNFLHKNN